MPASRGRAALTEDDLIAAIRAAVEEPEGAAPRPSHRPPAIGIGDDAAAWRPSRSNLSVISTDALIDGVHFVRDALAPEAIGARAMASNLSDIAAMGARPRLVTVALGITAGVDHAWILACYRAMAALARRFGATIAGGDVVRAPALLLALTIVGEVSPSHLKRRDRGRPGDVLAVTGPLGASRAGLELVRRPALIVPDEVRARAFGAYAMPIPRVREGRWLAGSANVHAMMDISDGLSTDVARLARASGCGATIDDVPCDPVAASVAAVAAHDALAYALDGGEDFELLVAIAPRAFAHLARRFVARFDRPLRRVGTLDARPGLRRRNGTSECELVAAGYDHVAGASH